MVLTSTLRSPARMLGLVRHVRICTPPSTFGTLRFGFSVSDLGFRVWGFIKGLGCRL